MVSIAYRVILEALTNVRRHAPGSARMDVSIVLGEQAGESTLTVRVANEAASAMDAAPLAPLRGEGSFGGRGLAQLSEAVESIGGTLTSGMVDRAGTPSWEVSAALLLRRRTRS